MPGRTPQFPRSDSGGVRSRLSVSNNDSTRAALTSHGLSPGILRLSAIDGGGAAG